MAENSAATDDENAGGLENSTQQDFKGPYTIAIDIEGSVIDKTALPYKLDNGKATYNGAPISLMCIPCNEKCESCQPNTFLVLDSGLCIYGSCPWPYIQEEKKNTCRKST